MYNELFSIGPITIYGFGLMIALGVLAAYWNTERLAKKGGLNSDPVFNILIIGVGFGILGAKLLYYVTIIDEIIANPKLLLDIQQGFVVYGGIILGIASAALYCKKKKLPFFNYLDCAAPSIALAQGFGRIGCFLAGCCYGTQMDCPISITFTNSAYAPNNVPLFPSQLVSSAFDFVHFFILCALFKRNQKPGKIGAYYLVFYSIGRFAIEFFRGDLERGNVGALSTSQFISLFVAVAGIALIILLNKKKSVEFETATAGTETSEADAEETEIETTETKTTETETAETEAAETEPSEAVTEAAVSEENQD
ncbi:MAG: prolipoprotein diacylglyceryl transferase [Lachnospiraceae bacterium]|nr:prolipoprotein diacylglyceryl transferase [Lachnospiraceae bacterium]